MLKKKRKKRKKDKQKNIECVIGFGYVNN